MRLAILAIAACAVLPPTTVFAQEKPVREGTCVRTTIQRIETRLIDGRTNRPIPMSGSSVTFANGVSQVDYAQVPAVDQSRPGDPVYLCLIQIPRDCPPGDTRGRIYTTTNLRSMNSWTMKDSPHGCGGA